MSAKSSAFNENPTSLKKSYCFPVGLIPYFEESRKKSYRMVKKLSKENPNDKMDENR